MKNSMTQKIKWCISIILLVFLLSACNSSPDKKQTGSPQTDQNSLPSTEIQSDSIDIIVKSIIKISADDFYKNQQPLPVAFRNVQIRFSIKPNKEVLYILCGEFSTQDKQNQDEWIHFTTIKNIEYEQWIGPNGLTYCENSKEIPYSKTNLSVALLNQLNSLEKTRKQ